MITAFDSSRDSWCSSLQWESLTYCLKDVRRIREESRDSGWRREALEALGEVLGRLVVVVEGGGLGSSLQQTLGRVSFPLLPCGQQKLPYPMSLQPSWLPQGREASWLKYSSSQHHWLLQQDRAGQSDFPFSEQSTTGSMQSPLCTFLLSGCLWQERSLSQWESVLQDLFLCLASILVSSFHG